MVIDMLHELLGYGLSQREISRRAGIPQPSLNRLLHGRQADLLYEPGKRLERVVSDARAARSKPADK